MKFKKLEISGFKSFFDKTTFSIEDGLTGIVGPNGCGKSNIVEASTIFDLPHPLGPTIPVKPSSIEKVVLSKKDLNPDISNFLNFIFKKIYSVLF